MQWWDARFRLGPVRNVFTDVHLPGGDASGRLHLLGIPTWAEQHTIPHLEPTGCHPSSRVRLLCVPNSFSFESSQAGNRKCRITPFTESIPVLHGGTIHHRVDDFILSLCCGVIQIRQPDWTPDARVFRGLFPDPVPVAETRHGGPPRSIIRWNGKLGSYHLQVSNNWPWGLLGFKMRYPEKPLC